MTRILVAAVAALLVAATCNPLPPPGPGPGPSPDAGPSPLPPTCSGWCERARELGCRAGDPTPAGTPCETVCTATVESGIVNWDLACMVRLESCDDQPRCARRP